MPSIFSRSRTTSTGGKKNSSSPCPGVHDEFGRVPSRGPVLSFNSPLPSSKKEKKTRDQEKRLAQDSAQSRPESRADVDPLLSDGSFLPLSLDRPRIQVSNDGQPNQLDYGYLSYERHVVLGIEQAARLVVVISQELTTRGGVTTPFIFSTTALDISSGPLKRLIRAFINTCVYAPGHTATETQSKWRDEARFAGPHELGMCLRWGLARVVRSVSGNDVRGLISWDHYLHFRESEAALNYPPAHFSTFLLDLIPAVQSILISILTLLSRLTANSKSSGHTPPTLSPFFGPLLFGLGPATLPFHHTYIHYLRAVQAMEHILLAFIRWQDIPQPLTNAGSSSLSGSVAALGVPIRLKEWIKGYPALLPFLQEPVNQKPQARKGVRTIRIMSVRRNVRKYSPDLVKTAASWGNPNGPSACGPGENGLLTSKEWARITSPSLKLQPRYSEGFKKRMNMPSGFQPDFGIGTLRPPSMSSTPSSSSYVSTISIGTTIEEREGEDRFRSLTDLKWGEFESLGFSGLGANKLEFDLTESARATRTEKRETLTWSDFSAAGFSRSDVPLKATLQFSPPITKAVATWPSQNIEITKKLKKTEKSLPAFGWDTEPVIGSEELIEESFVDVFCDLIYGGGWMDLERVEELDRDCNWALVEFKSLLRNQAATSSMADPRTSTSLVLFEEFVPLEYRQQLSVTSSTRRRLPSLFPQSKAKTWKPAPTLNGRPYVVGHVPRSPSYREFEFEGLLNGATSTKVITLEPQPKVHPPPRLSTISTIGPESVSTVKPPLISGPIFVTNLESVQLNAPLQTTGPKSDDGHTDSSKSPSTVSTKRSSRFRIHVPLGSPGGRRAGITPSEYSTVDFETRLAGCSDDEFNATGESDSIRQRRRASKDDAWVDILVGSHARRLAGLDGEPDRRRAMIARKSDPEMASLEVAQVLASVRERVPSSPSPSIYRRHQYDRVDTDHAGGLERFYNDQDVDEIETVPRTSVAQSEDYLTDQSPSREVEHEDADDEDDVEQPSAAALILASRQKRRLGYFDLHPERRTHAADHSQTSEDDPSGTLAYDVDSVESEEESGSTKAVPRQIPKTVESGKTVAPARSHSTIAALKVQLESNPNEIHFSIPDKNGISHPVQSKTAALIEMYRERERNTPPKSSSIPTPVASLPTSRLPARAASPLKEVVAQVIPPPPVIPPPAPVPEATTISPDSESVVEIPSIMYDEADRASPARYVHGAPLHNVMEEDEEE